MTSGPLSGLAEPRPSFVGITAFNGMHRVRAAVRLLRALVVRAFDWQWECVRRAEERDMVARMGSRERSDLGLPPRGDRFEASGFWRH